MPSPLLKNFGELAETAVSVGKALRPQTQTGSPGGDGSFVEAAVSTTQTSVEHTLGRVPTGWLIVDADAGVVVYRSGEMTSTFLPLTANGPANVKVWVF